MPPAGFDPAEQLAMAAAELQVTAWIFMRQAATQFLSNVMSLSVELSDQSNDRILHVQRSLWTAEWRADCLRCMNNTPPTEHTQGLLLCFTQPRRLQPGSPELAASVCSGQSDQPGPNPQPLG